MKFNKVKLILSDIFVKKNGKTKVLKNTNSDELIQTERYSHTFVKFIMNISSKVIA